MQQAIYSIFSWLEILEGIGAGRFEGYKLGYTAGSNRDADMAAIGQAATQQEVVDARTRLLKKRAVAKILNRRTFLRSPDKVQTAVREVPPSSRRLPNRQLGSCCHGLRGVGLLGGGGGQNAGARPN
jgi:hypothetical protein